VKKRYSNGTEASVKKRNDDQTYLKLGSRRGIEEGERGGRKGREVNEGAWRE
jgi:hypothetical protein